MIKPIADRLVVKVTEAEEKTSSGILLPDTAQEKPQKGKVVAVGPGRVLDNGDLAKPEVRKGDTVLFSRYGGTEVTIAGKEYMVLRESDVLAIVK
ncbi:MAG: co-chaperone GroES [Armatimonadota bacterium]|nr:MAG: co-chaperone GroES [Armatimonadota bacterium]